MFLPWPPGAPGRELTSLASQGFSPLLSALAAAFAGNTLPQAFAWLPLPLQSWLRCQLFASSPNYCA